MDIHYHAFISYRHHPEDIRVATEIHRALERYHIPKAVRKNARVPMRLFRDKDELPITSNLSDDIFLALKNSDYLIVICSTHTKESQWVQREIETFLKTHTYDKVLTVLVDGEPYDTIPEILQYREEVDPVTGAVTRVPLEPLSCDWRVGKKIAHREELPRLAAALLNCSYDELRQRQRQYKMRRLMTILGAATVASLCLMSYFLYTSIIIQQANDDLNIANEEIRQANEEIRQANEEIQQKAASLHFRGNELLVVSSESQLIRFSMDGTCLSQTDLYVFTTFYTNIVPAEHKQIDIEWIYASNGELILDVFGLANIVDSASWDVRAYVLDFSAYDGWSDRLICRLDSKFGYFPRFTTEQVMQIAREELGGFTLSEEMKAYYGIG